MRTILSFGGIAAMAMAVMAACAPRATMTAGGEGAVFSISRDILSSHADTLVDIGKIKAGEVIQYDAWIRNTGDEPLVIERVETSCGCTSVEYEKKPIAPEGKGRFSFRFDSRGFWGMQLKLIEIHTSASPNVYRMMVRSEVENEEMSHNTELIRNFAGDNTDGNENENSN